MNPSVANHEDNPDRGSVRDRVLAQLPWIPFVLPLVVFMLVGSLEATPNSGSTFFGLIRYEYYPAVYTAKIVLTTLALVLVWPAYRVFPYRVSPLAVVVGVVGVVLWIVIVDLKLEQMLYEQIALLLPQGWLSDFGERSQYNPLKYIDDQTLAYSFLAVRFFGLAIIIAIAEEMFLRGFIMRYIQNPDSWPTLSFAKLGWPALIASTVLPMLMHLGELFAALVWFSMITWLLVRTRRARL